MQRKTNQDRKNIVLTGGHAGATAYALIEEIKLSCPHWDICWFGTKKAFEGKKVFTYEYEVFPKMGIKFYPVFTGRLQRKFTFWTIPSLLKIPVGFVHAFFLLINTRPDTVVSFGGSAAFPVVVGAWMLRIPVIIHEQTAAAGRANIYSSFFAKSIALARAESRKYFPESKIVVVGNPVSKQIISITPLEKKGTPMLFVTGGSRGSEIINLTLLPILPDLLKQFRVVHQVGQNQISQFADFKQTLTPLQKNSYEVLGFINPWEWYKYIQQSSLIVARAGANLVSEIMVAKRPAILIPIPWSYLDEQRKNALIAQKFGLAVILEQKDLNPSALLSCINALHSKSEKMTEQVRNHKSSDIEATGKMIKLIKEVLNEEI